MYKFLKVTSFILVLIGALNWGLIGFFKFNLVSHLFGEMSALTRIIYCLVGLSAIVSGITAYICHKRHHHHDYM